VAATYQDNLTRDIDKVRAELGGNVTILPASDPLLTDEHITGVLSWMGSHDAAVSFLAHELVARFAGKPTRLTVGDLTLDYQERIPQWQALANRKATSTGSGAIAFVPATYGTVESDEYGRPWGRWS
jgi:hypothetical protein